MGVRKLFDLLEPSKATLPEYVVVDAMTEIYKSLYANTITDSDGRPTGHINTILMRVINMLSAKCKVEFVFDGRPNPHKAKEIERRNKTRAPMPKHVVDDIKFVLRCLGVTYYITDGYDAEQLCAKLSDIVMTSDSDTFLYGAKYIIKYNSGKLYEYSIDDLGLTSEQLIMLGICLGTDYSAKIKGVGIKTALDKCRKITFDSLSDEQKIAHGIFTSELRDIPPAIRSEPDYDALLKWLEERSFNIERIRKLLAKIPVPE